MQTDTFSFQRLRHLIWLDIRTKAKFYLMIFATIFVLSLLLFSLLPGSNDFKDITDGIVPPHMIGFLTIHLLFFPMFLLASGIIFTSISFLELSNKPSRQFYLSIPAKTSEKFFSKWILSAVIFPVVFLLLYQIFAQFTYSWGTSHGVEMVRLSLLEFWPWKWIGVYMVIQSIFLLGALAFPRFALIRTILFLAGLALLVIVVFQILVNLVLINFIEPPGPEHYLMLESWIPIYIKDQLPTLFWRIAGFGLFPLLLVATYFKLKEKEVTHGV